MLRNFTSCFVELLECNAMRIAASTSNSFDSAKGSRPTTGGQGRRGISTNKHQQNTAATAEPSSSGQSDKCLQYSEVDGFYRSSPFEPIQTLNMPLHQYVWRDFKNWENQVAAVCVVTGRQYTYAEMRDACAAMAVRLQLKFKLVRGDVLAICLPNLPEYPIAALSAIEAGLTVTTVNPIYTPEEICRQLMLSNAKFIICTTLGFANVKEACKLAQKNIPIVCTRFRPDEILPAGALDFADLIRTSDVDYSQLQQYDIDPESMVFLPFSSGTTGMPKGVMLSHNNITFNCQQVEVPLNLGSTQQEVVPAVLPFFHIYGLTVVMLSKLGLGSKLVTMPQFKPEDLLKALHEYKSTVLNLVPPIAIFMTNHPKVTKETVPALRYAFSGAAPIGAHDVERFIKKFPNTKFLQGYGMTETSPVLLLTPENNTRYASTGVLTSNTEAKIIPLDSTDFKGKGPNVTGELCVRGPQVMSGYLNNEEANKEIFMPGGWLRTGDVAYFDEDGYFYITDRMKELIKVKGFQVPPAELEAILRDHPKILEAAVFGVPHETAGEAVRAMVVLQPGQEANEEEIYNYVAERVAHYKKLDGGIIFATEVPKNPTGKILRKVLKEKYSS